VIKALRKAKGMVMKTIITLLLSCICVFGLNCLDNEISAAPTPSQTTKSKVIKSPDGQREARITVGNAAGEITLELLDSSGHMLLTENYTSYDQNSDLMLAQSEWTQDSRYFVYSTWHVKGHEAMNSPTFVYSRDTNRIINIEDRVGYIDVSDFGLSPSDVLSTQVYDANTNKSRDVHVTLPDLFKG
jgi:hypothetical protein